MPTRLVVPIMVDSVASAHARAAIAGERGADLVEYRLDTFVEPDQVGPLVANSPLPCIVTCRPTWEGGDYDGNEQERISLLEHACLAENAVIAAASSPRVPPVPPAYLDVELAAYQSSANFRQKVGLVVSHDGQSRRDVSTGLILSTHDFTTRPPDLDQRILAMADAPACRVIKAAWRARSLRDNLEAFEILQRRLKPTIALCMGEFGLPSRVLARKFGALLTFASLDDSTATAPGQPTVEQLKNLYRWDAIGPDTAVYGVIGYPVGHSLSPAIHNAGFDAADVNAVYLPLPIPPEYEHFKATVLSWLDFEGLHFGGASVTIPHKQNLLRFVEEQGGEIEPLAAEIGAANTLTKRDDGSLYASNTDYAALLDAVCDKRGVEREALSGTRVAVLGAGGAARAAVAAFTSVGGKVTVFNRTAERAADLAARFRSDAAPLDTCDPFAFDLVINCTPVGMHPDLDATPLARVQGSGVGVQESGRAAERGAVHEPRTPNPEPRPLIFDTIYNPPRTRLLREAEAAGCDTISGVEMFVRQAAAQFTLWTGHPAPLDVFRRVMAERSDHPV